MIDADHFDAHAFVAAAAPAVGLHLDAGRRRAVAEALILVARIGGPAFAVAVAADEQPAPVFAP